jgi:hypothetical protein
MSIFEMIMLLCFGAAWPFSVYKSYTSRSIEGKSFGFLIILLAGYVAGIVHKIVYSQDKIIYLYVLNFIMILTDTILYLRNKKYAKEGSKN